jgi:hypothetical protein
MPLLCSGVGYCDIIGSQPVAICCHGSIAFKYPALVPLLNALFLLIQNWASLFVAHPLSPGTCKTRRRDVLFNCFLDNPFQNDPPLCLCRSSVILSPPLESSISTVMSRDVLVLVLVFMSLFQSLTWATTSKGRPSLIQNCEYTLLLFSNLAVAHRSPLPRPARPSLSIGWRLVLSQSSVFINLPKGQLAAQS